MSSAPVSILAYVRYASNLYKSFKHPQNTIFITATSSIKYPKSASQSLIQLFSTFPSKTAILGPPYSITDRGPDPPNPQSAYTPQPTTEAQTSGTDRHPDPQTSQRSTHAPQSLTMPHGADTSHDAGSGIAPEKLQEKLTQEDEEEVADSTYESGSSADMTGDTGVSHGVEESEMSKDV